MSESPTPLPFPSGLPYPITITRLLVTPSQEVSRGTPLLEYSFTSISSRQALAALRKKGAAAPKELKEWDMVGSWESGTEGQVVRWAKGIGAGSRVEAHQASRPVLYVQQPCTHPVQFNGMCGICGKDLTADDYLSGLSAEGSNSQAGPSRHKDGFEMSHDAMGVTVSTNEAQRLENQTRTTLLGTRKLSLIVDLDQTVIHTTVDPTVGEWMAEIEKDREAGLVGENPNAEALRDVARFQLADDLPPGYIASKGKGQAGSAMPERWYYTKPRPGLLAFLDTMSESYEMHVYTMGTRSYADAICKVIDPEGRLFGGRILSRDESGSLSSKNLQRLFPTDQSMVVVIDDRADVWGDCPNLVKVVPYDFFLGIGDINSSFLPPDPDRSTSALSDASTISPAAITPSSPSSDASTSAPTTPPDAGAANEERLARAKLLDQVSEERPLAKLQEQLESVDNPVGSEKDAEISPIEAPSLDSASQENGSTDDPTTTPGSPSRPRKPLLSAFDDELARIGTILQRIHADFYSLRDMSEDRSIRAMLDRGCNVDLIIKSLKEQVFDGCKMVFSGLIPRGQLPESSHIWMTAETFGAQCSAELQSDTTHCVTANNSTEKVHRASKLPDASIVWADWFWKSVALWKRQSEKDFLAHQQTSRTTSGLSTPNNLLSLTGGRESILRDNDEDVPQEGGGDEPYDASAVWDDEVQAELDEIMDGSSDVDGTEDDRSEIGSSRAVSPPPTPGTPSRKRVRYADEETPPARELQERYAGRRGTQD